MRRRRRKGLPEAIFHVFGSRDYQTGYENIRFSRMSHLKESEKGPVVVAKNGKPVAVLVGVTDEEEIERLVLAYSPKFQAVLARGRQQIQKTGGMAHKDFWQEMEAEAE